MPKNLRGITLALLLLAAVFSTGCMRNDAVPGACGPAPTYPPAEASPRVVAEAGPDFDAKKGERVTLDGSASLQAEGKPLTYHWDQLAGPCVSLEDAATAQPSFTVPNVPNEGATLVFRLVVENEGEYSDPDEAEVVATR